MSLATIPEALEALRAGKPVIVADDEARENEGDVILSASSPRQEWIAWTVRSIERLPLRADAERDSPTGWSCRPWSSVNEDARGTAYTVCVDAADRQSTGISASDRAHTLRVLADPDVDARSSVIRPGHILPLRAVDGGVRERAGHTEAAVDLMRLAGLAARRRHRRDRRRRRRDDAPARAHRARRARGRAGHHDRSSSSTYLERARSPIDAAPAPPRPRAPGESARRGERRRPRTATFRFRAYRTASPAPTTSPIVSGDPARTSPLVRVHSECLTGEAFGSLKCECGPQLDAALDAIQQDGGVVVYLRGHEGRGIGLINKLRAYRLQERRPRHPRRQPRARAARRRPRLRARQPAILADLGIEQVRLLTNNPDKVRQLRELGLDIVEQVPLLVGVGPNNHQYLDDQARPHGPPDRRRTTSPTRSRRCTKDAEH